MHIIAKPNMYVHDNHYNDFVLKCPYCSAVIQFNGNECKVVDGHNFLYQVIECPNCGGTVNADPSLRKHVLYKEDMNWSEYVSACNDPTYFVV